jgi:hypothetical protein
MVSDRREPFTWQQRQGAVWLYQGKTAVAYWSNAGKPSDELLDRIVRGLNADAAAMERSLLYGDGEGEPIGILNANTIGRTS